MKIGRDDTCASCGLALPASTRAYWFADERVVRCEPCHDVENQTDDPEVIRAGGASGVSPTTTDPATIGTPDSDPTIEVAGRSAQSEYEKRSAKELARKQKRVEDDAEWRAAIKERRPVVGRIASALTPKPEIGLESQSTKAWKTGAEGERRVAEVLAEAVGVEVLHDRRVPDSKANIDHIAVGPAGVFVIDAKKYTGQVEVRDVGGLFRTDERLYVNDRDRTKLVEGVLGQIEVVRDALGDEFASVDVHGVLCFVDCEWGWFVRQKHIKGVTALWPNALADHLSATGEHVDQVRPIADHLRLKLRPAT
jgi:hypothetical protein